MAPNPVAAVTHSVCLAFRSMLRLVVTTRLVVTVCLLAPTEICLNFPPPKTLLIRKAGLILVTVPPRSNIPSSPSTLPLYNNNIVSKWRLDRQTPRRETLTFQQPVLPTCTTSHLQICSHFNPPIFSPILLSPADKSLLRWRPLLWHSYPAWETGPPKSFPLFLFQHLHKPLTPQAVTSVPLAAVMKTRSPVTVDPTWRSGRLCSSSCLVWHSWGIVVCMPG